MQSAASADGKQEVLLFKLCISFASRKVFNVVIDLTGDFKSTTANLHVHCRDK
jgi:hypothetical protein